MANIKIPYALIPAVGINDRRANMRSAIARKLPRLDRQASRTEALHVACYGPSLKDTWERLRGMRPIVALSGATKFLFERGIVADFSIIMDPRRSQLQVALPPVPGVTYLVASCVHPDVFDQLITAGNPVVLWHTVSTNWEDELQWVKANDPDDDLVVHPGSTVGLAALQIGGVLGFTRFEIHGMDGSFDAEGQRHAGPHGCKVQPKNITWDAGGVRYHTSKIMANAVAETINTAKNFPIITIWHGQGLTQALIREANLANACCADETEKRAHLTGVVPRVAHTPPLRPSTQGHPSFWDGLLAFLKAEDWPALIGNIEQCEPLRALAKYNTGTIPFESAVYLRALSRFYGPKVIAEVGTFIGTSTRALLAERVIYTCDRSNNCIPSTLQVFAHPHASSTEMFAEMQEPVDLFFFDGRIADEDLPHIQRLSHPGTVYVVDDCTGREKGVINLERLQPLLGKHAIIPPSKGPSTLAVAVPFVSQVAA